MAALQQKNKELSLRLNPIRDAQDQNNAKRAVSCAVDLRWFVHLKI